MMNTNLIIHVAILLLFCSSSMADDYEQGSVLGLPEIIKIAIKKHGAVSLPDEFRKSTELEAASTATFDNPVISYGKGRLQYNGGAGNADYDEFSISQNIPLNGFKSSIKKQGRILGKLGELEGQMLQFKLSSQAILAAVLFHINKEKNSHSEERLKNLRLISKYLQSRKFQSPKQRINVQLIENKIDEILLETRKISSDLESSRKGLELFIGQFKDEFIILKPLSLQKVDILTERLTQKETYQDKRFEHLSKVIDLKYSAAKKRWIPDLQLYYSNSNERYSGGNRNQVLGVGIEVPLFNFGNSKKRAILAQKAAAKIQYELDKNEALNNRNKITGLINASIEFLRLYSDKKIKANDKKLKRFQSDFKKGLISASSFLDLEDQDHNVHNERLNSQLNLYSGLLNLIEISGDSDAIKEIL